MFFFFFLIIFVIDYLESTPILLASQSGSFTCNLLSSPPKNKQQVHFVVSICSPQCGQIPSSQPPPREDESFSAGIRIHARSHQLRRAMLYLEQGETSSPRSPPQPAPQCPCRRLVRVGTSSPVPLDINMTSSDSPEHGHS